MTTPNAAVVFDVDGTLITGSGANLASLTAAARDLFGLRVAVDYVDELPLINGVLVRGWVDSQFMAHMAELAGADFHVVGDALRAAYTDQYIADLRDGADPGHLIPGIPDALQVLADRGHMLGLATGNAARIAQAKMAAHGLDQFFSFGPDLGFGDRHANRTVIGAAAVQAMHPSSPVYLVGDQASDMQSARQNGVTAVGVLTGACSEDELREAGAHVVLASVTDLPDLLLHQVIPVNA